MNLLKYIPYVLLFMLATMIIYAWGLYKAQRASADDTKLLYSKAVSKITSTLKKQHKMTRAEIVKSVTGLYASRPFSKNKIAVTDPETFADNLISFMITQKIINKNNQQGVIFYVLPDSK